MRQNGSGTPKSLAGRTVGFLLTAALLLLPACAPAGGDSDGQYREYEEQIARLRAEQIELRQKVEEPLRTFDPDAVAVITFSSADRSVYDNAYPLLKKAGMTASIVVGEGKLPGTEGMMTVAEARELAENGWDFAVGDDPSIDLLDAEGRPSEEWLDYVDGLRLGLSELGLADPVAFCFGDCRYEPLVEAALSERGFLTVRHYYDDSSQAAVTLRDECYRRYGIGLLGYELSGATPVYRVGTAIVRAAASAGQTDVESAIRKNGVVSVALGRILPTVEDKQHDCTVEKFATMLNSMIEYHSQYDLRVEGFASMIDYKRGFERDLADRKAAYEADASGWKARIEEIDRELTELMASMVGRR